MGLLKRKESEPLPPLRKRGEKTDPDPENRIGRMGESDRGRALREFEDMTDGDGGGGGWDGGGGGGGCGGGN